MAPFPVTVRYRFGEGGEGKDAIFRGLFFDRSEETVLGRLREAHRFAAWVEVAEVQWSDGGSGRPASLDEGRRSGRQYFAPQSHRRAYTEQNARTGCGRGGGMGEAVDARGDGPEERRRGVGAGWTPRRHPRCSMFKPAQVFLEDAVLECVLLDLSPGGAQVYLIARAELPELVVLRLPDGESRPMRRCWQRGSHIGFEAAGESVRPS